MIFGSPSSGQSISVSSQPPAPLQLPQVPNNEVTSQSGSSITNKVENDSAKVRTELLRPMTQLELNEKAVDSKEKSQEGSSSSAQLTMTKDETNKEMQKRKRKKETNTSLPSSQDEPHTSKKPVIADSDKVDGKIPPPSDDDSAAPVENSSVSYSDNETKLATVSEESNNNNTSEDVSTKTTGSPEVSDILVSSAVPHKLSLETTSSHPLIGSEPNSDYSLSPPVVESQHQPKEDNASGANPNDVSSTTSDSGSKVYIQNHGLSNYDFVILV